MVFGGIQGEKEVKALYEKYGAIREGHFVFTNDQHSSIYLDKKALYQHRDVVKQLTELLAVPFVNERIECVIGPASGGIILSEGVASFLNLMTRPNSVVSLYAEKNSDGTFFLEESFKMLACRKRALFVEDHLTTGGSITKVIEVARQAGAIPAGLSVIWNRGGVKIEKFGVSRFSMLVNQRIDAWSPSECPLCAAGIPIDENLGWGSGK